MRARGAPRQERAVADFVGRWEQQQIAVNWFGDGNRSNRFWAEVETAVKGKDNDLREVLLLCIAAGFRGDLHIRHRDLQVTLRQLVTQVQVSYRETGWPVRDDGRPPARVPPLRGGRRWLPRLVRRMTRPARWEEGWRRAESFCAKRGIDLRTARLFVWVGGPFEAERAVESLSVVHRDAKVAVYRPRADAPFALVACREAAYLIWTGTPAPLPGPAVGAGGDVAGPPTVGRVAGDFRTASRPSPSRRTNTRIRTRSGTAWGSWHNSAGASPGGGHRCRG